MKIQRTPLYMAFKNNHLAIAQLLIYYKADPWSSYNMDYNQLVRNRPDAKKLLSRARKVNFLIKINKIYNYCSYIFY